MYVKHIAPGESVGAGIFKDYALMGIFPLPHPHVAFVKMISVKSDPWVIPSPDLVDTWGEVCGVLKRYVFDDHFSIFSVELVNLFAS